MAAPQPGGEGLLTAALNGQAKAGAVTARITHPQPHSVQPAIETPSSGEIKRYIGSERHPPDNAMLALHVAPSVLPDISPARGEITLAAGFGICSEMPINWRRLRDG
jgi:hypothetical protein